MIIYRRPALYRRAARPFGRLRRHPVAIPVVTLMVLIAITSITIILTGGNTIKPVEGRIVLLTIEGRQQPVPTRAETVREFIIKNAVEVRQGDRVEPDLDYPIIEDNFRINVYRARPVTVVDGGRKISLLTAAATTRSQAEAAGLKLYPEDAVYVRPPEEFLRRQTIGPELVIDRATPANLNLYGAAVAVRSRASTVGELLREKQVRLAPDDQVQPALDSRLSPNLQVFVLRRGTQITTVAEEIAMPVEYVDDASLTLGAQAIRQRGNPGRKLVTYQIELQNGREIGRRVIQEVQETPPVKQIVARGRAVDVPADKESVMAAAGIAASDYGYVNYIVSRESGWCPTKLQGQRSCPPYPPEQIPGGLGYGLVQATPGSKMASAGGDWQSNPVTQLRWASGYASRYGGWSGSYNFWLAHNYW